MGGLKEQTITHELAGIAAVYVGDPDKDGTWKMEVDASTGILKFSYRISGTWVLAESFVPPSNPAP